MEAATEGGLVGVAIGAAAIGAAAARNGFRRVKNRRKPSGERDVNERVVLVFYADRVDVHGRQPLRTNVGGLLGSHPLADVVRDDNALVVGGTRWMLSSAHDSNVDRALEGAGIELGGN